jgi:glycosyltransferase involved in cell wall biosynthesis
MIQELPLVSVIVAVTGTHFRFLGRALESILAQTFRHFEVLVMDDGCEAVVGEDVCRNLVASYAASALECGIVVGYHQSERIQGIGQVSAEAVRCARAPYIVRIDADDTVESPLLDEFVNGLEAARTMDSAVAFAYGNMIKVWDPGTERAGSRELLELDAESVLDHGAGALFLRKAVLAVGNYNHKLTAAEDHDLILRLYGAGYRGVHLPGALYYYWQHGANSTRDRQTRARVVQEVRHRNGLSFIGGVK